MAIQSFSDENAEALFTGQAVGKGIGWTQIRAVVRRKLDMMHYAINPSDLRSPAGNRLEELEHDLKGYHSMRVNDQWRIIFRWTDAGPAEVAIVDYHNG